MATRSAEVSLIGTEQEKQKVLAFDLSLEWQRIHESLPQEQDASFIFESRKRRFMENAWTYAKEASGVPVAKYPPYRIVKKNGKVALYTDDWSGPVRELFNPDRDDPQLPWPDYRLNGLNYIRAQLEYKTFSAFERSEEFANAREGEMFVWISMPPTEILLAKMELEVKKKCLEDLGYGFHTNTFVMARENGFLQAKVIPNYLDPEGQRKLLHRLTGKDWFDHQPSDLELLGVIVKVKDKSLLSSQDIKDIIDEIYKLTPDEQKIKPSEDKNLVNWIGEQQMEGILYQVQPMLELVYYLLSSVERWELQDKGVRELIERRFRVWENAIARLRKREVINLEGLERLTSGQLEEFALVEINEIKRRKAVLERQQGWILDQRIFLEKKRYLQMSLVLDQQADGPLSFGGTGCGTGSGFGNSFDPFFSQLDSGQRLLENPLDLALTYQSTESLKNKTHWEYRKGNCVVCQTENVEVGPCNICKSCEKKLA